MIQIQYLVFNPFQLNTYILFDETREAVIIDPACYGTEEEYELAEFIRKENLKPVRCLVTHSHVDHLLGVNYVYNTFGLRPEIHQSGLELFNKAPQYGRMYGFQTETVISPESWLNEGDVIRFGTSSLDVIYTPGHADGSVCFLNRDEGFVIAGDVLFHESIGRTDLPGGDFELLSTNIQQKLFSLDDHVRVYPGHGPETNIGHEKRFNPFLT
jgi:glyoxylase-like metal-dependent hydrolase (beta-lactamase superfamily II)